MVGSKKMHLTANALIWLNWRVNAISMDDSCLITTTAHGRTNGRRWTWHSYTKIGLSLNHRGRKSPYHHHCFF